MARKTKAEKWHGAWINLSEGDDEELFFYDHGVTLEEMFSPGQASELLDHLNRLDTGALKESKKNTRHNNHEVV